MKFNLLLVFSFLFSALVATHAVVTSQVYWNSVLPDTPMPEALTNLLTHEEAMEEKSTSHEDIEKGIDKLSSEPSKFFFKYKEFAEPSRNFFKYNGVGEPLKTVFMYNSPDAFKDKSITTLFFLEDDMHQGGEVELLMTKDRNPKAKLLSQKEADSIPFSSDKLPQIYQEFSVDPDSKEARTIKESITECESTGIKGEEIHCATSLESMIDFTTKKLGKKVKAISTQVNTKENSSVPQKYTIEEANQLGSNESVVACHTQRYPYAVFYCHMIEKTRAYSVSLVGEDGTKVNKPAVCHKDTSNWSPMHISLQVLKVGPGAPVCHFLPEGHVVWVPY